MSGRSPIPRMRGDHPESTPRPPGSDRVLVGELLVDRTGLLLPPQREEDGGPQTCALAPPGSGGSMARRGIRPAKELADRTLHLGGMADVDPVLPTGDHHHVSLRHLRAEALLYGA